VNKEKAKRGRIDLHQKKIKAITLFMPWLVYGAVFWLMKLTEVVVKVLDLFRILSINSMLP